MKRMPRSWSLVVSGMLIAGAPAALASGAGAAPAPAGTRAAPGKTPDLKVLRRIPIGGEGGWDCLTMDAASHRLFVTHGTRVVVVDVATDSIRGEIPDTPGVHDVALAHDIGRGFTSNGRDSSVSVFDLATLAPVARIKLPARNPDIILYDPASGRVFTFNGGSATATAIDARADTVVGSIPLGGKPEFAVVDGAGLLFVNIEDSSAVVQLDTRSLKPMARWSLAPGEEPTGLALDAAHHRLFAACSNKKLIVMDSQNGRIVSDIPIGDGVDGAAFDARRGLVFTSNGEGSLSVIREETPDRFTPVQTVTTERGARTIAVDESTGMVYVVTADFGPAPAPTPDRPHPRPSIVPGTFRVLAIGS